MAKPGTHGEAPTCRRSQVGASFAGGAARRGQRVKRTSVNVSPRNGSVWVAPSRVKPLRV